MAARSSYERGTRAVSLNAVGATGAGDEFGFVPYYHCGPRLGKG